MYQCSKKVVVYKGYSCFDHPAILAFWHIQCLHLMYAEVTWVRVYSGTQGQLQITLDPDYLPDYPSVSYDYGWLNISKIRLNTCKLRLNIYKIRLNIYELTEYI